MPHRSNLPRVLIVDDDPITLRFFQGALSRMAECVIASDGAMALTCAKGGAFDLLVIDLNLPDMRGEQLLEKLQASHATARAVATSAEVDADIRKDVVAHGFDDIIEKPIALDRLLAMVGKYLGQNESAALLDDDVALKSLGGDRTSLHALRSLLAAELDDVRKKFNDSSTIDHDELSARLHRLRASCGFCGATALAAAAVSLQQSIRANAAVNRTDIDRFLELCRTTAQALRS